jgi:hypothetical protein
MGRLYERVYGTALRARLWDGSTSASRANKKFKVSYAYHY